LIKVSGGYIRQTILANTGKSNLSSFGESSSGEIYAVSASAGELYRIVSADPGGGPSRLSVSSAQVTEGINDIARIRVTLSPASSSTASVRLTTNSGSATPGSDFVGLNEVLTFAPGQTVKEADITILDNSAVEPEESFTVRLTDANGAEIESPTALVTIKDDDVAPALPTLSIDDRTVNESDGSVTVTIRLSRSAPAPVSVNFGTAADTASAGSDFTPLARTVNFAQGQSSQTLNVGVIDDSAVESDERFFVRLSSPSGATIADELGVIIIEDDDTGVPTTATISVSPVSVPESAGSAQVPVRLSRALSASASVGVSTALGSATAGQDYYGIYEIVTFSPGQTVRNVSVPILDDTAVEGDENVTIRLFDVTGAELGTATANLTIEDNDQTGSEPSLSVSGATVGEADGQANIQIALDRTSSQVVRFGYATSSGTATPGSDFYGQSGVLVLQPGQRVRDIAVEVLNDSAGEGLETFTVRIFDIEGAEPGTTTASVNIIDDDSANATLSIVDQTVNEGVGTSQIEVRLSGPSSAPVSVDYATVIGSAVQGSDYWGVHSSIQFAPGETVKRIPVVILDDNAAESNETFVVRIYNATGATISNAQGRITIIDND